MEHVINILSILTKHPCSKMSHMLPRSNDYFSTVYDPVHDITNDWIFRTCQSKPLKGNWPGAGTLTSFHVGVAHHSAWNFQNCFSRRTYTSANKQTNPYWGKSSKCPSRLCSWTERTWALANQIQTTRWPFERTSQIFLKCLCIHVTIALSV